MNWVVDIFILIFRFPDITCQIVIFFFAIKVLALFSKKITYFYSLFSILTKKNFHLRLSTFFPDFNYKLVVIKYKLN